MCEVSYSDIGIPGGKGFCQRWSRDQPQPGSFSQLQREIAESLGTRLAIDCLVYSSSIKSDIINITFINNPSDFG